MLQWIFLPFVIDKTINKIEYRPVYILLQYNYSPLINTIVVDELRYVQEVVRRQPAAVRNRSRQRPAQRRIECYSHNCYEPHYIYCTKWIDHQSTFEIIEQRDDRAKNWNSFDGSMHLSRPKVISYQIITCH